MSDTEKLRCVILDLTDQCREARSALTAEREKVATLTEELRIQDEANDILTKHKAEAEAHVARLREAIERAPHGEDCDYWIAGSYNCNCWKAEALQGEPK